MKGLKPEDVKLAEEIRDTPQDSPQLLLFKLTLTNERRLILKILHLASARQAPEADGEKEPDKDKRERLSRQEVRTRLLTKYDQGNPWPGYTAIQKELGVSRSTAHKAVSESPTLMNWMKQSAPRTMPAQPLNGVVTDNTPQSCEPDPADMLSDEDVDLEMTKLINAADEEVRANLNYLNKSGRRELVRVHLGQQKDRDPSPLDDCPEGIPGFRVKNNKHV